MRRSVGIVWLVVIAAGVGSPAPAGAQSCSINVPHITGQWSILPYQMPINPISATLLHTGQILLVAGSENDASNETVGSESFRAAVWDPTGTTASSVAVQELTYDVFCSGTAVLPDGRPLVVGGTASYAFTGDNRASIFNPLTGRFAQVQSMVDGRWYATATTLGDGRVMTFSGANATTGETNNTVEIYDPSNPAAGWSTPATAPFSPPWYPRMALLPDGTVFFTGQGAGSVTDNSWIFEPSTQTWTVSAPTIGGTGWSYGSAVLLPLLPPSYAPRMINFGGGNPATSATQIIDLSAGTPTWTPGPDMSTGRTQMNAVMLPDGTVLALDGSVDNEIPDAPGRTADLLQHDPMTDTYSFTSGGTAAFSRLYHSTAVLLPDARVMSLGSNPGARGGYEPGAEIYTPAYLYDANDQLITNRPSITGISPASGVVGYGATLTVTTTSASPVSAAVLMRPGSATHAFDMEQRLVGLCGPAPQPPCSVNANGKLKLTTPPNGNVAPPGYYMLFLVDTNGVPSVAATVRL